MADTTKAAKLLQEVGAASAAGASAGAGPAVGVSSVLPPPPSSGNLPFSIPFNPNASPSKPVTKSVGGVGDNSGSSGAANITSQDPKAGAKGGALSEWKGKWVVVKDKCSSVLRNQGIAAIVVFVIVAGIMAAVNPPIVQKKGGNADEKPKRSVVKILVWATVAAALAMVIPIGIEYAKNKKRATVT